MKKATFTNHGIKTTQTESGTVESLVCIDKCIPNYVVNDEYFVCAVQHLLNAINVCNNDTSVQALNTKYADVTKGRVEMSDYEKLKLENDRNKALKEKNLLKAHIEEFEKIIDNNFENVNQVKKVFEADRTAEYYAMAHFSIDSYNIIDTEKDKGVKTISKHFPNEKDVESLTKKYVGAMNDNNTKLKDEILSQFIMHIDTFFCTNGGDLYKKVSVKSKLTKNVLETRYITRCKKLLKSGENGIDDKFVSAHEMSRQLYLMFDSMFGIPVNTDKIKKVTENAPMDTTKLSVTMKK